MQIEISDKGPGFDAANSIKWEEHLGLAGMRERVESMGGVLEIQSMAGEGTVVNANISLQHAEMYAYA
ncbi:MAG: hypothetical protein IPJ46_08040 [Anaerolineales bacterium]|nr:hypothetical protein [Anaerolineales bacterium]